MNGNGGVPLEAAALGDEGNQVARLTGELDPATIAQMGQPRCGFPDFPTPGDGAVARFAAQGSKWPNPTLHYGFVEFTPQLIQGDVREAIAEAFELWSATSSSLSFTQIPPARLRLAT